MEGQRGCCGGDNAMMKRRELGGGVTLEHLSTMQDQEGREFRFSSRKGLEFLEQSKPVDRYKSSSMAISTPQRWGSKIDME